MGQYQQWVYHQEIDQQLRSRLELLEVELAQLQMQARPSEEVAPSVLDNVITQALLSYQASASASAPPAQDILPTAAHTDLVESSSTPVSQALLAWSRLPHLDSQGMHIPPLNTRSSGTTPTPEGGSLLPQDMSAFFHQHMRVVPQPGSQPELQPQFPTGLENAISASDIPEQLLNSPVDQQTLRTNRRVERWLERWRKTSPDSQEQREDHENESHRE